MVHRRLRTLITASVLVAGALSGLTATAPSAAALGNGLALTPPMGFNDWNAYGCNVSESLIKQTADKITSSGMAADGYQYVNIDDCWLQKSRDANGNLQPDLTKFPDGISGTAAYVHTKGLKLGIYEDAGTATCAGYPGSLGHEQQDANSFAAWGVDYLKYDNCNNTGVAAQTRYTAMRDALAKTGRPILFSLCNWGQESVWNWGASVGNLWRTTGDISANFSSMLSNFHTNVGLASHAAPGGWNDPDMLEIGNGMSATEDRSEFSLWSEMAAPLISGTNLVGASSTTLSILTNKAVIAVDQDSLGKQGVEVSSAGGLDVLAKPLAGGDVAVALFNENSSTATISTTVAAIGKTGASSYTLTDLWSGAKTSTSSAISASVPAHGTVLYRVSGGTSSGQRIEAEAAGNTIAGAAVIAACSACSGGQKVGYIGNGAANYVTINNITETTAGTRTLTINYLLSGSRSFYISVNGGTDIQLPLTGSSWTTPVTTTVTVNLAAGTNTIKFHNDTAYAPDLDVVTVN
ncbi:alpha-galactosidase [Streptacidiphilus sp. MAP12-20]|uniref:alpha-galactosidase D n=1 Tax=Streptacidiphilus sp. MAP12-20 TaxID=3156299 RepID=UPI003511631D